MFKIKYQLNKMHPTIFSHQVGWFDGKGIDILPLSMRIKTQNDIVVINNDMLTIYTLHNLAI
jgi:hypothetical protein